MNAIAEKVKKVYDLLQSRGRQPRLFSVALGCGIPDLQGVSDLQSGLVLLRQGPFTWREPSLITDVAQGLSANLPFDPDPETHLAEAASRLDSRMKEALADIRFLLGLVLIVFVWDDMARTEEHAGFKQGLRRLPSIVDAVVVSRPSKMMREQTQIST